jgi:hypothetical protein
VAAEIRQKYGQEKRQTNTPPQTLLRSNGLYDFQSNAETTNTTNGEQDIDSSVGLEKRAPSKYLMPHMTKNGLSPYAPDAYKVSRLLRRRNTYMTVSVY